MQLFNNVIVCTISFTPTAGITAHELELPAIPHELFELFPLDGILSTLPIG